jgi:type VI secretion system protein ImpH
MEELIKNPKSFSYFQAVRLVYLERRAARESLKDVLRRDLRVRADASLGFPASDLSFAERSPRKKGSPGLSGSHDAGLQNEEAQNEEAQNEEAQNEEVLDDASSLIRLTVTFMGLYGAASPLPPFYAEGILNDVLQDEEGVRELLDLISHASYENHALAYFHNQLPFRLLEDKDPKVRGVLSSLMGRDFYQGDFDFFSLFSIHSRSAAGLSIYLKGKAQIHDLYIEECVLRELSIPIAQRAKLGVSGNILGRSALIGQKARDLEGKFRVWIKADSLELFEELMPGGDKRLILDDAIKEYLDSPLVYDIILVIPQKATQGVTLGAQKGRLGLSAFLSPTKEGEIRVRSGEG